MPRRIVASVASKFSEVEKRLRLKPNSIEEVADQRQFIESLPRKVAELVAEMDAAQVPAHVDPDLSCMLQQCLQIAVGAWALPGLCVCWSCCGQACALLALFSTSRPIQIHMQIWSRCMSAFHTILLFVPSFSA